MCGPPIPFKQEHQLVENDEWEGGGKEFFFFSDEACVCIDWDIDRIGVTADRRRSTADAEEPIDVLDAFCRNNCW